MSSAQLFIRGLSYSIDETSLREAFHKYGEVIEARVVVDRETSRSRGFGFVTFTFSEEASSAIQALDGQDLHGRRVRVNFATDRTRFDDYGGGGYGGNVDGYGSGEGYDGENFGVGGGSGVVKITLVVLLVVGFAGSDQFAGSAGSIDIGRFKLALGFALARHHH